MMVKSLKILLIIFGVVFAQSPDKLYQAAQSALDAGKVSEAESGFQSTIQMDPTFAPAYLGLAHTSMRMGDLKKTGSLLKEAIEIEPENQSFRDEFERLSELNTLMSKGIRSMKNGDADDAFESFYINAWPILKSEKIPFILFVSTREIGKHGYMTWDQI